MASRFGGPLLPCAPRFAFAFGLAAACGTLSLASPANAADPSEDPSPSAAPAPEPAARFEWGVRPSGAVGVGGEGLAGRLGLDVEYWLTDNIGIGAQLAYEASTTLANPYWPSEDSFSGSEHRLSLAPSVAVRGNGRLQSLIVSLAVGFSWGRKDEEQSCELDMVDDGCTPGSSSTDVPSYYGSLAAAWMFHPGHVRPGSIAFAIGPVTRIDTWFYAGSWNAGSDLNTYSASFTVGLAMGFDVARGR